MELDPMKALETNKAILQHLLRSFNWATNLSWLVHTASGVLPLKSYGKVETRDYESDKAVVCWMQADLLEENWCVYWPHWETNLVLMPPNMFSDTATDCFATFGLQAAFVCHTGAPLRNHAQLFAWQCLTCAPVSHDMDKHVHWHGQVSLGAHSIENWFRPRGSCSS